MIHVTMVTSEGNTPTCVCVYTNACVHACVQGRGLLSGGCQHEDRVLLI